MANIASYLNDIKNAIFGKEVRGSIHDGIKVMNDEVESTTARQEYLESTFDQLVINAGNSNAEIVDARVEAGGTSYKKLGDRLNKFDEQFNTKANKNEIFSMSNMGQDIKEAMTGGSVAVVGIECVSDINVIDKSINPTKTTFIERSKNLLNTNKLIYNYYINNGNGNLTAYDNWVATDFIDVESNTSYLIGYLYNNEHVGILVYYAFYDKSKAFIKGGYGTLKEILTSENAKYIRLSYEKVVVGYGYNFFGKKSEWGTPSTNNYENFWLKLDDDFIENKNVVTNVYGSGLILPITTTSDAKFKMQIAENSVIYYNLKDRLSNKAISIAKDTIYNISPNRALIIDSNDNIIKEVKRSEVNDSHVVLLQTGEYNNNFSKYLSGFFANRVTVTSSYEDYDLNNVRKKYSDSVDTKIVDTLKNTDDFTFIINTDLHYTSKTLPCLNTINRVQATMSTDAIINLGDSIMTGYTDINRAYKALQGVVSKIQDKNKLFCCVGNHDYNHSSDVSTTRQKKELIIPYKDIYKLLGRHQEYNVVWGSKERMYYYKDFENKKVRLIVLNTLDRPEFWNTIDGIEYDKYTWLKNIVGTTQINWLINNALNFSDKQDKTEWHTLVCCHCSPDETIEWNDAPLYNGSIIRTILEAFQTGIRKELIFNDSAFDGYATINSFADFTSQGQMKVIGVFSGHNHIDVIHQINNINYITTVCGYTYNINESTSMSQYKMIEGELSEFGIDVCTLDKQNRTLKLNRIGVGTDRLINY